MTNLRSLSTWWNRRFISHSSRPTSNRYGYLSSCLQEENKVLDKVLDGKSIARQIRQELKQQVTEIVDQYQATPGLAVVIVGNRKDSLTYVQNKNKFAKQVGIESYCYFLSESTTERSLLELINDLNGNPKIHGILVQLPLPGHISSERILNSIHVTKDVDGFHPENVGRLCTMGREPLFIPCTPQGCMELLERYQIPIQGKNAIVLGRSNIVGIPTAMLLLRKNATVQICHSYTQQLAEKIGQADIVVSAMGQAGIVRGHWLKPSSVVIDVGINAINDVSSARGYRLVGDVVYEEAYPRVQYITPVPGGVGPMTIAMLLKNTIQAFLQSRHHSN
eukprot:jgi/Galph1/2595/GphlegSOOS_G1258.1